jgi:putative DNA primase/helicase
LSIVHAQWPNDEQSRDMLQEWFGYLLLAGNPHQKALLVHGPKRSGKGTIANVMTALMAPAAVCSTSMASLAYRHGLEGLVGKRVAVMADERFELRREDASEAASRLLKITGGDLVDVQVKYGGTLSVRLPVKIICLTNELPRLADDSAAIVSRFLVLRTTRSYYGEEDVGLGQAIIRDELPGVFLWAVAGLRRLQSRGRFAPPTSTTEDVEAMVEAANPLGAFVAECCTVGEGWSVRSAELYRRYREWCGQQGVERPMPATWFGRRLISLCPTVSRVRLPGETTWTYMGVASSM